jgi:hypothetical protein
MSAPTKPKKTNPELLRLTRLEGQSVTVEIKTVSKNTVQLSGTLLENRSVYGRIEGHVVFNPPNEDSSDWFLSHKISGGK